MTDLAKLQKELDRVTSEIFLLRRESYLAHILCSASIIFQEDAKTGYTNGLNIVVNPKFFLWMEPKTRVFFIAHMLWHVLMMHSVMGKGKVWYLWQMACDYWINNMLVYDKGYSHDGLRPWLDSYYQGWDVNDIYADLQKRADAGTLDDLDNLWGYTDSDGFGDVYDLRPLNEAFTSPANNDPYPGVVDDNEAKKMVAAIVKVTQYAAQNHGGYGGREPFAELVEQFLQPRIPWEKEITPFLTALDGYDYTYSRPNPRYRKAFLPARQKNSRGGLDHIVFAGDSSGSMTMAQMVRINSEARYVLKRFQPEKLTLMNFDDNIRLIRTMTKNDPFDKMEVVGRGGTDLRPLREWIIKNKPKAVIVFTDMGCDAMVPLEPQDMVPMLWIVFNNPNATVPHGKIIHINE